MTRAHQKRRGKQLRSAQPFLRASIGKDKWAKSATMLLTLGADHYTMSKLLGYSSIKTTQVYAKIIDPKKVAAVNLADKVFD